MTDVSHSQRGEWWLEKHLEKIGKKKEDLAKELWDRGLTAVAEVSLAGAGLELSHLLR